MRWPSFSVSTSTPSQSKSRAEGRTEGEEAKHNITPFLLQLLVLDDELEGFILILLVPSIEEEEEEEYKDVTCFLNPYKAAQFFFVVWEKPAIEEEAEGDTIIDAIGSVFYLNFQIYNSGLSFFFLAEKYQPFMSPAKLIHHEPRKSHTCTFVITPFVPTYVFMRTLHRIGMKEKMLEKK